MTNLNEGKGFFTSTALPLSFKAKDEDISVINAVSYTHLTLPTKRIV